MQYIIGILPCLFKCLARPQRSRSALSTKLKHCYTKWFESLDLNSLKSYRDDPFCNIRLYPITKDCAVAAL